MEEIYNRHFAPLDLWGLVAVYLITPMSESEAGYRANVTGDTDTRVSAQLLDLKGAQPLGRTRVSETAHLPEIEPL